METPDLPYLQEIENNTQRYRAIHHPTNIELYVTDSDAVHDDVDKPFWANMRPYNTDESRPHDWLLESTWHTSPGAAIKYLVEKIDELPTPD